MKTNLSYNSDLKKLTVVYFELNPAETKTLDYLFDPNFISLKKQQYSVRFKKYISKIMNEVLMNIWRLI